MMSPLITLVVRGAAAALLVASIGAGSTLSAAAQQAPPTQPPPPTQPATPPARPAPPAAPRANPQRPNPGTGAAPSPGANPAGRGNPPARNPNLTLSPDRQGAENAPQQGTQPGQDEAEDPPPPIQLDPPVCDFGFVEPSATPKRVVKLINTSDQPLTILAVQPSCKCTTINDIVGTDIPPHGSVDLEASMKAQSSPGGKKAEIKVLIDGFTRVINIQLVMEVTLPVRVIPGYINAVKGQPQEGRFVVESLDKQPFSVCSVHGRAPKFVGFDPAKDAPRNQYLIAYDVNEFKQGEMPLFLLVETDHPACPIVDVRLRHEYTFPKPVLKMQEYRLTLGKKEQGESGEIHLEIGELPPEEPLVSVASPFPGLRLELIGEPEKEGVTTKYRCKVTPPPDFAGLLYAPITLYTTRRQQEMWVWGMYTPKGHTGCLGVMEQIPGTPAMRFTGKPATAAAPATPAAPAAPAAPVAPAAPAKSATP